ncbi:ABC transporter permease [Gordonia metallireducens]|uniref:ABC transporter permease n=1 Tax=Gordonia metallireducens TaxID=2897779 RepID=UPI001E314F1B|nr:ABC transporter permease subunit [Gordonia metallireducens]
MTVGEIRPPAATSSIVQVTRPEFGISRSLMPTRVRALMNAGTWGLTVVLVLIGVYEAAKAVFGVSDTRMPHSWSIAEAFFVTTPAGDIRAVALGENIAVTLQQSLVGVALGVCVGAVLGVITAKSVFASRTLTPVLVATQTLPLVAIVPALVILLGDGWFSRAVIASLLAFFPVYVAVARALGDIPTARRQLFVSMGCSRMRTLVSLDLPLTMLAVATTMRTATALAVTGSIVAELPSGTDEGIAATMLTAASYYLTDPEALWCAALVAMVGGVVLVFVLSALVSYAVRILLRMPADGKAGQ